MQQARAERAAWRKQYYEPAKARFDQLCQNAGEKIYRTADNVDGILLLKVRGDDEKYQSNRYNPRKDQMWEDAAVESELEREGYIEEFLFRSAGSFPKYAYVDVVQKDDSITRYSTYIKASKIGLRISNLIPIPVPAMPLPTKTIFLGKTANIG